MLQCARIFQAASLTQESDLLYRRVTYDQSALMISVKNSSCPVEKTN